MANEMTGITFWKHSGYTGDITKKCALSGDDLDRNFFNLKSEDIKNVRLSGNTLLVDTWRKEKAFSIDLSKYSPDMSGYFTSGETLSAITKALEIYYTSAETLSALTIVYNAVENDLEDYKSAITQTVNEQPLVGEIIKAAYEGHVFSGYEDDRQVGPFYKQCEVDYKLDVLSGNTEKRIGEVEKKLSEEILDAEKRTDKKIKALSSATENAISAVARGLKQEMGELAEETYEAISSLSATTKKEVARIDKKIEEMQFSAATKEEIAKLVEEYIQPKFNEIDETISNEASERKTADAEEIRNRKDADEQERNERIISINQEKEERQTADEQEALIRENADNIEKEERKAADFEIKNNVNTAVNRIIELEQQVLDIQAEIADIKSKLVDMIEGTDNQIMVIREEGRCKIGFADDAIFAADNND